MNKNYILLLSLIISSVMYSQDANKILRELQAKFESISNLSADFLQSSKFPKSQKPILYKGTFYFEKENKYRIELRSSEIVCDGKTVWNYNKNTKKVIVSNIEDDMSAFSINNIIYNYPKQSNLTYIGKEQVNGISCNILQLFPKGEESNFNSVKIWIDENNLIREVEISDNNNATLVFEFSNIRTNQKMSIEKFTFNLLEGIEIIDLR